MFDKITEKRPINKDINIITYKVINILDVGI